MRQTAQGTFYSRPAVTADTSESGEAAGGADEPAPKETEGTPEEGGKERQADEKQERASAKREFTEEEFQRAVQAENDRRESVRAQRERVQRERDLRRTNPAAYAQLKEAEETANQQSGNLGEMLRNLSGNFDEATVTPLVQAIPEKLREQVLKDAGHGLEGRKTIVSRAIETLKKVSAEEGYARGKADAEKRLRGSQSFRKELLSELRGEEDEPELAPASGPSGGGNHFTMDAWMRQQLRKQPR